MNTTNKNSPVKAKIREVYLTPQRSNLREFKIYLFILKKSNSLEPNLLLRTSNNQPRVSILKPFPKVFPLKLEKKLCCNLGKPTCPFLSQKCFGHSLSSDWFYISHTNHSPKLLFPDTPLLFSFGSHRKNRINQSGDLYCFSCCPRHVVFPNPPSPYCRYHYRFSSESHREREREKRETHTDTKIHTRERESDGRWRRVADGKPRAREYWEAR